MRRRLKNHSSRRLREFQKFQKMKNLMYFRRARDRSKMRYDTTRETRPKAEYHEFSINFNHTYVIHNIIETLTGQRLGSPGGSNVDRLQKGQKVTFFSQKYKNCQKFSKICHKITKTLIGEIKLKNTKKLLIQGYFSRFKIIPSRFSPNIPGFPPRFNILLQYFCFL